MISDGKHKFSVLAHWKDKSLTYEFQFLENDRIIAFPFISPTAPQPSEPIQTLMAAKSFPCKCAIGDQAGATRLYGQFSTIRDKTWFELEGVTKQTKEVYMPLLKGEVEIKNETKQTELLFNSPGMTGRWLMRELPNMISQIPGDKMNLLWKPDNKESQIENKLSIMQTMPISSIKGDPSHLTSQMSTQILVTSPKEFDVVVAAEGTWVDGHGRKFTYTKEFINTLYTNMNMQLLEGKIPIGVDKEHNFKDNGQMTSLQLLDKPIAHIKGRGFFNEDIGDAKGASIEADLDVVYSKQFQSFFPVNGITKRVSLVKNPACTVCYFTPQEG